MDERNTPNHKQSKNESNNEVVYKPPTYERGKQVRLIPNETNGRKESIFLYFSSLTADLVIFAAGCSIVWSSPAIQKLKSTDLEINPLGVPLTPIQEAWIAALPCLGGTIGPLLLGKFTDTQGRKEALMLVATLKIVSYIILAFATNIYLYYITRLFLGMGVGMCSTVLPVYTAEICESHNKGKFGFIMAVFPALGAMYTLSIGPLLSLKIFTLSCTIPLIFSLVSFILIIPETPVYLASIEDEESAVKALMKLRNKTKRLAEIDLIEIKQMIAENSGSRNGSYIQMFIKPAFRKGLIICAGLYLFQQLSGITAIFAFIGPIFELSGSNISANLSSILVAAVQVVTILIASVLVERLGRKFLLLVSIISSSVSLIMLGIYFYLKYIESYYIQSLFWLPVTSLMAYVISLHIGLEPVTWILISEIFPSRVRSTASSIVITFGAFTAFSVTFLFPLLIESIGMASCCWLFGGFCALGATFIYILVPETKGRTIGDIQRILSK